VFDTATDHPAEMARVTQLAESLDVGIIEFVDGACVWANAAHLHLVGRPLSEVLGSGWFQTVHPDDLPVVAQVRGLSGRARIRVRHVRPDGAVRHTDVTVVTLEQTPDGARHRSVVSTHDVTEEVLNARRELTQEQRFRHVFGAAGIGMAIVHLDGTVVDVNPAYCDLVRINPGDIVGRRVHDLVTSPDGVFPWAQAVAALEGAGGQFSVDCPVQRPDGTVFWARASLATVTWEDDVEVVIAQLADIDEQHRHRIELAHRADHDDLTGLRNRAAVLAEITDRLTRHHGLLGVLFCDLDRFKDVNDSYGHGIGDEVLRAVADRLRATVRGVDVVGRLGGDEFVVLLSDVEGAVQVERTAERVRTALGDAVLVGGQPVACGVSVGVAVVDLAEPHTLTASDVLRDADTAMYDAKGAGRGRVSVFSPDMRDRSVRRLNIENDLRQALHEQQFVLHYQPIVRLEDGVRKGFEALVRWNHPDRGLLLPWEFLDVAAECGLASAIDDLVLEEALAFLARHPGVTVSINTSPRRLDGGFAARVADGLRRYGVEGRRLFIELLETSLIEANVHTSTELAELAALGCPVLIDDFGTGYSALSYLRRLPVAGLKLDRSFVTDLPQDIDADRIAAAVAGLAGSFGLMAVAEGVETAEAAQHLLDTGWAYAQGWHFGRPAPEEHWFAPAGA